MYRIYRKHVSEDDHTFANLKVAESWLRGYLEWSGEPICDKYDLEDALDEVNATVDGYHWYLEVQSWYAVTSAQDNSWDLGSYDYREAQEFAISEVLQGNTNVAIGAIDDTMDGSTFELEERVDYEKALRWLFEFESSLTRDDISSRIKKYREGNLWVYTIAEMTKEINDWYREGVVCSYEQEQELISHEYDDFSKSYGIYIGMGL